MSELCSRKVGFCKTRPPQKGGGLLSPLDWTQGWAAVCRCTRVVKKLDESEVFITKVLLIIMFSSLFLQISRFFWSSFAPVSYKPWSFVNPPVLTVPGEDDRSLENQGWTARGSQGAVPLLWFTALFLSKLQLYPDADNTGTHKVVIHLRLLCIEKTGECAL